jgi:tRNA (mo5U34)-methyltransferase
MKLDCSCYTAENQLSETQFQELLNRQPFWFHNFEFSNGCSTFGRDPSEKKLHALRLPSLKGKSVIDIGAFDGFFSLQAEALGASRVVSCDHLAWTWPGACALANLELVERICYSSVKNVCLPVEELSPESVGLFDVTLFLGVLYHASDMAGYLRKLRSITAELAVIETLVDGLHIDDPYAAFYPGDSLNNDASNWWGPNIACVLGMLEKVGFGRAEYVSMWDLNSIEKMRGMSAAQLNNRAARNGRAVFHAYVR